MAEGIITRRGGVAGEPAPTFIEATGGTETTYTANSKNYKVHTFTSSGNFVVTQEGNGERAFIDYLVIAGGAGGGEWGSGASGGGGAGGYRTTLGTSGGNSNSELKVFLPVGTHPVIIGAGGATANRSRSFSGNHSSFLSIFSVGGGVGGGRNLDNSNREIPMSGGSGGGGYGGNVFLMFFLQRTENLEFKIKVFLVEMETEVIPPLLNKMVVVVAVLDKLVQTGLLLVEKAEMD